MFNKRQRLHWAKEYEHWTVQDWLGIIWTDKSSFYVGGFHGRVWVTRNAEEEYNEQYLTPPIPKIALCHGMGSNLC